MLFSQYNKQNVLNTLTGVRQAAGRGRHMQAVTGGKDLLIHLEESEQEHAIPPSRVASA